jgi:hypothetical protein
MYKCIPVKGIDRKNFNCVSGWNDLVDDKHEIAMKVLS